MQVVVVVTKSCLSLCEPMDCSTSGSSILRHLPENLVEFLSKSAFYSTISAFLKLPPPHGPVGTMMGSQGPQPCLPGIPRLRGVGETGGLEPPTPE